MAGCWYWFTAVRHKWHSNNMAAVSADVLARDHSSTGLAQEQGHGGNIREGWPQSARSQVETARPPPLCISPIFDVIKAHPINGAETIRRQRQTVVIRVSALHVFQFLALGFVDELEYENNGKQ